MTKKFHDRCSKDVREILAGRRQIAIIWGVEDVQSLRPDLSGREAWAVLESCEDEHDCNHGFTWDLIERVAEEIYPRPLSGEAYRSSFIG